jgi:hypothetical protein
MTRLFYCRNRALTAENSPSVEDSSMHHVRLQSQAKDTNSWLIFTSPIKIIARWVRYVCMFCLVIGVAGCLDLGFIAASSSFLCSALCHFTHHGQRRSERLLGDLHQCQGRVCPQRFSIQELDYRYVMQVT